MKKIFNPEYLYIPYLVLELQPAARFVFGAIYYFEKMKDGKCFASNEEIARIAHITPRSVANSLGILEKAGFIKRIFSDKNHRNRKEIKCLIKLKKVSLVDDTSPNDTSTDDEVSSTNDNLSSTDEQISNNINKKINNNAETSSALNNLPLKAKEKENLPAIKEKESPHQDLMAYFSQIVEKVKGFKPKIDGGDGKALKTAIKTYTITEIEQMIDFYIKSEKAEKNGISLKSVFTTHSINLFHQRSHKTKFL